MGDLKIRYRDPETTGEVSYTVKGAGKATIRVMVIDSGSNNKGPQFGGSEINIVVQAPKVPPRCHCHPLSPPDRPASLSGASLA